MRTRTFGALAGAALALAGAPGAGAAVLNVNCATGGNLQAKLNAAPGGSTIRIKGTCHGTFGVTKKLTLQGNPTATLDGDDGGSVISTTKPLRLVDLKIVDGTGANGGGIYAATGAKLTLVRTTVSGNVAVFFGGGIAALAPVVLRHSTVTGNKAEYASTGATVTGGGIVANSVTLTDSTVSYNRAHATGVTNPTNAFGGGIVLLTGGLVATRSHVNRNTAQADGPSARAAGAGIFQQATGTVRLTGSTVSKNVALTDAPVGTSNIQGAGVVASKVVAQGTSFVGNRGTVDAAGVGEAAGGAVYLKDTGSTFTRVRIRNTQLVVNATTLGNAYGGAILLTDSGASLTIANSTISGGRMTVTAISGQAQGLGGALHSAGRLTVTRSTISGNRVEASSPDGASATGGGLRSTGRLTIRSSTISGNTLDADVLGAQAFASGGGVALDSAPGQSTITNSTFTGNVAGAATVPAGPTDYAVAQGGGIFAASSALRLVQTTVARNRLVLGGTLPIGSGAGIYSSTASLELRGSLLAGNTGMPLSPDCGGPMASLGFNLIANATGCGGLATKPSDRLNKPAKLGTLGPHGGPTRTIPLKKGSKALNAIPKASCKVKRDQRGVKRPQQKRCEMGAWERKAP